MDELDILDMDPIKLIWRPDTASKSHVWENTTFNSKKSSNDAMSDAEKDIFEQDEDAIIAESDIEQSAFRSFRALYSDTYIDYCSNPFYPNIKKTVVKDFLYLTIEDFQNQ